MNKRELYFDIVKKNHQAIYTDDLVKYECALNLFFFGRAQFMNTYLYQNIEILEVVTRNRPSKEQEKILLAFAFNSLIDSIKISICFENTFKAILLLRDCLIHDLKGRSDLNGLNRKIKNSPILVESLLELKEWEIHNEIALSNEIHKQKIDSISNKTIAYSNLILKSDYREIISETLKIEDDSIFDILNEYREKRNKLHLHASIASDEINSNTYNKYIKLKKIVDKNILSLEDKLSKHLGVDKKPTCVINRSPF